jgi:hypothetical protein
MPRAPGITVQLNAFVDGGQKWLGLATATLPSREGLAESVTGAGLAGEYEIVSPGHRSAPTLVLNFRSMLDDPLNYHIGSTHNFDLRTAQSFEDTTTFDQGQAQERIAYRGQIKTVNPGTRAPHGAWDASIEIAVRREEHFMDGRKIYGWDIFNGPHAVNGVDLYAGVRAAIN